jgi:hypothetical protein
MVLLPPVIELHFLKPIPMRRGEAARIFKKGACPGKAYIVD